MSTSPQVSETHTPYTSHLYYAIHYIDTRHHTDETQSGGTSQNTNVIQLNQNESRNV